MRIRGINYTIGEKLIFNERECIVVSFDEMDNWEPMLVRYTDGSIDADNYQVWVDTDDFDCEAIQKPYMSSINKRLLKAARHE
jgi:hypothetical protein